jgi:hypothetical protein
MRDTDTFKYKFTHSIPMEERDIISEEEQQKIINACDTLDKQALFAMLYLTGARIAELCNSYKRVRSQYVGNMVGVITGNIKVVGRDVSITLPIRKKRTQVKAEHTLVFDIDTIYMDIILKYAATKTSLDEPLFDFSTRTAERYIKQIDTDLKLGGVICKLFRNTRLTKISKIATTEEEIRQWAGHSDSRSLGKYIAMRPVTTFKKMIR